jgi:hypothetical protein
MEWTDQVQKLMQSWAETQQKMWASWMDALEPKGRSAGSDIWERTVDTWQHSVHQTLDAQSEWMQTWTARFGDIEGAPKEVADWAREGQTMMKRWNDAQRELWGQWFDVLRKAKPEGTAALAQSGKGEEVIRAWQDTARKAMETQMQWAGAWMGGGRTAPKKAPKSAQRSSH